MNDVGRSRCFPRVEAPVRTRPPGNRRVGWAYSLDLADGAWLPSWVGEPLGASLPSRELALSLTAVTPDAMSLLLEDRIDDPCRLYLTFGAVPWVDPSFASTHPFDSRTDLGDRDHPIIVEVRAPVDSSKGMELTLAGTIAPDGAGMKDLVVSLLVRAEYLNWTGPGDGDTICARAADEATPYDCE